MTTQTKQKYTPHESETSYTGQYPNMSEFEKPWEGCIQVGQGNGKISLDEKPLESEGFSNCVGLILRNKNSLEGALFHIDDIDLSCDYYHHQTEVVEHLVKNYLKEKGLSNRERLFSALHDVCGYWYPKAMKREKFQEIMEELNKDKIIQARFVGGNSSRTWIKSRIKDSLFGFLGIPIKNDILVDTGIYPWDLLYKPNEEGIYVNSIKQKKVLAFKF